MSGDSSGQGSGVSGQGEIGAVLLALWDARGQEVPMGELLRQPGATVAKVQAALEDLAESGCRIERSPGGVSLATAGLGCWRELITTLARRHGWRLGRKARVYPEIASTNDAAWEAAGAADGDGAVVLANVQSAGRGRLGRVWHAQAGQSVLLSVVLRNMPAAGMDRLTLLAGLATAEGLERAVEGAQGSVGRIEIKWPNDLLVAGRKLAGILVEARKLDGPGGGPGGTGGGAVEAAVVGIGINVAQGAGDFPAELAGRGISLFMATGLMLDRMRVAAAVLARLNDYLTRGDNAEWLTQWKERCGMLGRQTTLRSGDREITGQVLDIDPLQGLSVRDDQGVTHFLSARTCTIA